MVDTAAITHRLETFRLIRADLTLAIPKEELTAQVCLLDNDVEALLTEVRRLQDEIIVCHLLVETRQARLEERQAAMDSRLTAIESWRGR